MKDDEALKLFSEIIENVRKATAKFPCGFSLFFTSFVSNLADVSSHINNKNLRICFFYLYALNSPFQESYDTNLRSKIYDELKELLKEDELDEGLREIVINASKDITVKVFGDNDARDVIDMGRLKEDMGEEFEALDESTKILVLSKIAYAIRRIYDGFAVESSKEVIEFYDKLIESSKKSWTSVYDVILDCVIESDNKAINWKRGET